MQQAREAGMVIDHITVLYCADADVIRGGKLFLTDLLNLGECLYCARLR